MLLAAFALLRPAYAADPQGYKVEFVSVGNSEIDDTLKSTSDLEGLRSGAPVSPFGLIARARSDMDRLKIVLESFGYYESAVIIKIDGMPLNDPTLGDALTALPKGTDARVVISFNLGTIYSLRRIDIEGEVPPTINAHDILGLIPGQAAIASNVLAGGTRLQTALQEQGYAFATVDPPVAYEDAEAPLLDLTFHVVTGPKATIGQIRIVGLQRVHESLVRKRLRLHTGEKFKSSAIERARQDILGLNVFAQVSVQIGQKVDDSGGVPVTFRVRERLRHALTANTAYSSDLGASGGITWTDRNVFGNAEQLTFAASVINLSGSDVTGPGYDTSVKYLIPEFLHRDQTLQFALGALEQSLQAYDQTAKTANVTLSRKISPLWTASVGVSTSYQHVTQIQMIDDYTLLGLPLTLAYDSTQLASPLDDPVHGFRGSLNVTPTLSIGHPNATFFISQFKLATYFDLDHLLPTDPGRTVLAARILGGMAVGAADLSLPPDQRFYAGGSGTVRGYKYQGVGPTFNLPPCNAATAPGTCSPPGTQVVTDIPTGGTTIVAGSLELRQRFGTSLGAATFVDAGKLTGTALSTANEVRFGVGAGVRYYTPIGPIRFDLAVPVDRRKTIDDSFEVYIGLGQAF
jgi:translocation and assembly module TamA